MNEKGRVVVRVMRKEQREGPAMFWAWRGGEFLCAGRGEKRVGKEAICRAIDRRIGWLRAVRMEVLEDEREVF